MQPVAPRPAGDRRRREERALEEDRRPSSALTAVDLAAHDARETDGTARVGDHEHVVAQMRRRVPSSSVERLAGAREPRDDARLSSLARS